ncbi:thiamine pyrophosphate-binding protein [Rhizorhabdus argentea]|uniref:thiamine pyrophosphate-binding protein n=1 Tax=Rhizorhabdus argentea TaxID=1387174 RepID=UPI0030EBE2D9
MPKIDSLARGGRELVRFLEETGQRHLFGLPGSSMVAPLYELQRTNIAFVPAIHESVAVAAADGYARVAGKAMVMLYMLPGVANGMANLYNAWRDESPIVMIASQQSTRYRTMDATIGEGDLVNMVQPFTRLAHELAPGMDVRFWLERAQQIACGPLPGPTFLSIPENVFEEPGPVAVLPATISPAPVSPDATDVAEALHAAERPMILVGGQLRRFRGSEAIESLAEKHGIALAYEPGFADRLGVAPGHPNCFGNILFAPRLDAESDVVMAIGSRFLMEAHPKPQWFPAATFLAHINADPIKLTETKAAHWRVAADPGAFAAALGEALGRLPAAPERLARRRQWLESLRQPVAANPTARATDSYMAAVSPLHDAMDRGWVVDESVMAIPALAATLQARDGRRYVGTTGASLGWATGAAVGVALASGEPVTCVLGDGALRFGALGLWTIREQNLPITLVILDNGGYGSTRYFERQYVAKLGAEANPQHASYLGSDLRDTGSSVEGIIGGFGIPATRIPLGSDARPAIERAWAQSAQGPNAVIIEMPFGD